MKLTFEDIKSITRGALSVSVRDGFYRFERFSEEQKRVYKDLLERSFLRTGATSSVVLDFRTNSESLAFDYEIDRLNMVAPDYLFFDVWEDELMTHHIGAYSKERLYSSASIKLSPGEKRVRIFLPNLFKMNITPILLDDGASFCPTERKRRALILGDSITQGFEAHFPSLTYANTIIRDFDLDAVNQAIGGEIFRPEVLGAEPIFDADIITVAYGTNDWSSGGLDFGRVTEYFKKLCELYPRAKKIYISPIWRASADKAADKMSFSDAVSELEACAIESGFAVISGGKILHNLPQMYTDGLHPTDLGFTQYAKLLEKKLVENGVNY